MALKTFIFLLTLVEVVAVVAAFKLLGFWPTIGLFVASFMLGGYLLQAQGLATMERFVGRLERREAPMDEAWDGACLMVAALLFIIPGFATDLLALLLLLPPVRRLLRLLLEKSGTVEGNYWFDARVLKPARNIREDVIEAEYVEITRDPDAR